MVSSANGTIKLIEVLVMIDSIYGYARASCRARAGARAPLPPGRGAAGDYAAGAVACDRPARERARGRPVRANQPAGRADGGRGRAAGGGRTDPRRARSAAHGGR